MVLFHSSVARLPAAKACSFAGPHGGGVARRPPTQKLLSSIAQTMPLVSPAAEMLGVEPGNPNVVADIEAAVGVKRFVVALKANACIGPPDVEMYRVSFQNAL